jgi:hypothetical protein
MYVVGSVPELWNWDTSMAVKLAATETTYPTWQGTGKLPADMTQIKWKCLKREDQNPDRGIEWQGGSDNRLCTMTSCPNAVSAGF